MNRHVCVRSELGAVIVCAAWGALFAAGSAEAANVIKLDTASLAASGSNWSAAPAATDIGEFDGTCSAGNLSVLTLSGANLALGGLLFDSTMAGPATVQINNTLTLGTGGINMSAANQNVTLNCLVVPASTLANDWNVNAGQTLTVGQQITVSGSSGTTRLKLNPVSAGTIILNGFSHNQGNDGSYLIASGGAVTLGSVVMARTASFGTTAPSAAAPIAASSTSGFVVNGATASATTVTIGFGSRANSSCSMLVSAGSLTASGAVIVGKNTGSSRWNPCQVSGGTLTVSDTVTGLQLSPNNGVANYAELYVSGGTANLGRISFGASVDTLGGAGWVIVKGGNLYVGGGGMVKATPVSSYGVNVSLYSGLLGASADWSSAVDLVLSGSSGTPFTIQAADGAGAARTITLSGCLSGTGSILKTGDGTLILSGTNTYAGLTTISAGTVQVGNGGTTGNLGALDAEALSFSGTLAYKRSDDVTVAGALGGAGALEQRGTGALSLTGDNAYAGGTTVRAGALLANNASGSATGSGAVTVLGGGLLGGTGSVGGAVGVDAGGGLAPGNSVGALTVGSLTLSAGSTNRFEFSDAPANDQVLVATAGGLVLDGGTFVLHGEGGSLPWVTPGTYNLIQYSGALSGASTDGGSLDGSWTTPSETNPHVANPQPGYTYAFAASGGWLTLTIDAMVNNGTWTAAADGNWSEAGNWTAVAGTMPPRSVGDTATLGVGDALRTVALDANESLGALVFNNANSFVVAAGGGTLTLDMDGAGATVSVTDGSANEMACAVLLGDHATVSVGGGKALAVTGAIGNAGDSKTLAVVGPGTLTLAGANSYGPAAGATGTTLEGGAVLRLESNSALGAGDVSVAESGTLRAGVLALTLANNIAVPGGATATLDSDGNGMALDGVVSGAGALAKVGDGALTLAGANTYAGGTVVSSGSLRILSDGALPDDAGSLGAVPASAAPNNVILNGGALLTGATLALHANRGLGVGPSGGAVGGTAYLDAVAEQTLTVNGVLASAGNSGVNGLTVNGTVAAAGFVVLGGANTLNGTAVIAGGALRLANPAALQYCTLNYGGQGGDLSFGSLTAATLGGLSGSRDLPLLNDASAAVALTVGANGASTTFSGVLYGEGSLTKIGAGTLTLDFADYSGNTAVYQGGLTFASTCFMTTHLDISAQYGVARVTVDGVSLTSLNGLYITSQTPYSGNSVYGNAASLTVTNGAQVVANPDASGRAISYGMGNGRPGGNGSLNIGASGDTATRVTAYGVLDMFYTSGGGTVGNFAVNLNGGTLAVLRVQQNNAGTDGIKQTATFKFNGGVLLALTNDTTAPFFSGRPTAFSSTVLAGGAIIDDNGFNITVASPLTHGTGTPDGGLTKRGTGNLFRVGASSYTGPTAVNAGTLWANGTHTAGSAYTVGGGATLGGTGAVSLASGAVTLQPGAALAPGFAAGSASGGTLTLSALTLDATAGLVVDATNDQVVVTGDLSLNDNVVTVPDGGVLDRAVRYPILTCGGALSGTLARDTNDRSWIVRREGNTFVLAHFVGTILLVQ